MFGTNIGAVSNILTSVDLNPMSSTMMVLREFMPLSSLRKTKAKGLVKIRVENPKVENQKVMVERIKVEAKPQIKVRVLVRVLMVEKVLGMAKDLNSLERVIGVAVQDTSKQIAGSRKSTMRHRKLRKQLRLGILQEAQELQMRLSQWKLVK